MLYSMRSIITHPVSLILTNLVSLIFYDDHKSSCKKNVLVLEIFIICDNSSIVDSRKYFNI